MWVSKGYLCSRLILRVCIAEPKWCLFLLRVRARLLRASASSEGGVIAMLATLEAIGGLTDDDEFV